MLHKKIVIFLLLSKASRTLFYASEEQNNIKSQTLYIKTLLFKHIMFFLK